MLDLLDMTELQDYLQTGLVKSIKVIKYNYLELFENYPSNIGYENQI